MRPALSPSRPGRPARLWRSRLVLAASLVLVATLAVACTDGDDDSAGRSGAGRLGADAAALGTSLPASPAAAAEDLVNRVFGPDEAQAQAATVELLRRAGLPVVSSSGPVIAVPDAYAIGDVPVYAEFVPMLTAAVRAGDRYRVDQFVDTLAALGLSTKPLTFAAVTDAISGWGKSSGDAPALVSAAASVRALSAHRGQVLFPAADQQRTYLDPLQYVLLVAHSVGTFVKLKPGGATQAHGPGPIDRLIGSGVAHADTGPCDALNHLFDVGDSVTKGNVDFLTGELKDRLLSAMLKEGVKESVDKIAEAASKAAAVISSTMMMLGARLDLTASKKSTHFVHTRGSTAEHVKLTAVASYDIKVALEKLECYSLAGVKIPKAGPMPDMVIRWSGNQPQAGTIQLGGGKFLQAVKGDWDKFLHGSITGKDGTSTVELTPPREEPEGKGAELKGQATFTATLDLKESFPFEPGDMFGFLINPFGAAIAKSVGLIVEALTRVGLPSQSVTIAVSYHGSDILIAKGANSVQMILAEIPEVYVDLVSCEGPEGPFKGVAGYSGANTSGLLQTEGNAFGFDIPKGSPKDEKRLSVLANPKGDPAARFAIIPGDNGPFLDGELRFYSDSYVNNALPLVREGQIARPFGEVEILLVGESAPFSDLTFPITRIESDPRCKDVEYVYD